MTRLATLCTLALTLGCDPSARQINGAPHAPRAAHNVLDAAQLRDGSLADAIHRTRPHWLSGARAARTVWLHQFAAYDVSELWQIPAHDVLRVRYLSEAETTMRYGSHRGVGPSLEVTFRGERVP